MTPERARSWIGPLAGMLLVLCLGLTSANAFQDSPEQAPQDRPASVVNAPAASPPVAQGSQPLLLWVVESSGICGAVLLVLAFIAVVLSLMNLLRVRRDILLPEVFIAAFEEKLGERDYQGAYDLARGEDSLLASLLAAGLGWLNRGYEAAVEGMREVKEEKAISLEHRLSALALIALIAPLIGILGTVWELIVSFSVLAGSAVQVPTNALAAVFSEALVTTLEGLIVAIPASVAYVLLRTRTTRLLLEVGRVGEGLISRFSSVGKPPRSQVSLALDPPTGAGTRPG